MLVHRTSYLKLALPVRNHHRWLLTGNASSCWAGPDLALPSSLSILSFRAFLSVVVTTFDKL
jgi:hypothetical protein